MVCYLVYSSWIKLPGAPFLSSVALVCHLSSEAIFIYKKKKFWERTPRLLRGNQNSYMNQVESSVPIIIHTVPQAWLCLTAHRSNEWVRAGQNWHMYTDLPYHWWETSSRDANDNCEGRTVAKNDCARLPLTCSRTNSDASLTTHWTAPHRNPYAH